MRDDAAESEEERSSGLAPGPRKPIPPAFETATARLGPAISFMGAPIMRGVRTQG